MARIRTIKPAFWKDQKIGSLKRDIRLLFIGLWNLADDEGVVHANSAIIKSELFPFDDDLRIGTVQNWIDQLIESRMIIPFTFNCESYYVVRNFKAHQTINRPQESKVPQDVIVSLFTEYSLNVHVPITAGKEGKGKEIERKGKEDTFVPPTLDEVVFYFLENDFSEKIAMKAFKYYDVAGWKDSKGNKVKNWKQKMQAVWFKEENKEEKSSAKKEESRFGELKDQTFRMMQLHEQHERNSNS